MSRTKKSILFLSLAFGLAFHTCYGFENPTDANEARKTDIRFVFDCFAVAHGRVDSVVNPGTCAGHMHTFFGNSNIDNVVDVNRLQNFAETSCTAAQGSLYWVPSLYYKDPSGKYQLQTNAIVVVYYEFPTDTGETVNAIPLGFRQLVGDASRDTLYPNPPTVADMNNYWPYFTCYGQNEEEIYAMSIEEFANNGQTCNRLEATVIFRDCLSSPEITDSPNHKDHAAYSLPGEACPSSHPYRIPRVRMEVNWEFQSFHDMNDIALATGKSSASLHGDYLAGWDAQTLVDAANTCRLGDNGQTNGCTLSEIDNDPNVILVDKSLFPNEPVTDLDALILTSTDGCPEGFGNADPTTPVPVQVPTTPAPVQVPTTPAPITSPPPTNAPTSPQTLSPNAEPTDEDPDGCMDRAEDYFELYKENKDVYREKPCEWIAGKDSRKKWCGKMDFLHDQETYYTCPIQCGCWTEWEN